jgi:hypothetical protein
MVAGSGECADRPFEKPCAFAHGRGVAAVAARVINEI